MKGMLEMDPSDRYTALECLADPYFDGLRDPEVEKLIKGMNVGNQNSQAQIRQESSKSRSSMRSNTVERESISNIQQKNKTQYGAKFGA
jgi:serine/threonine protein kinase